jgi:proteasome lid subunit RPN8/RPN11
MFRRAVMLKVISWVVLSPPFAMATQLHCQPAVHNSIMKAWQDSENGTSVFEAAFLVREDGSIDYRGNTREYHRADLKKIPAGTVAAFHTHPNTGDPGLSRADRAVADQNGIFVYVISNKGLYKYSRPTGQILVAPDMTWEKSCK